MAMNTEASFNIPPEIVFEILTSLPVKSLARFRCVCKSWRSLISDPHFIKMHNRISKMHNSFSRSRILFTRVEDGRKRFSFRSCSVDSIINHVHHEAADHDHPISGANSFGWMVGSCDGMLCVSFRHEKIYLWNPSLRISRRLPHFGVRSYAVADIVLRFTVFGFGYDSSIDDYKVVAMSVIINSAGFWDTSVKFFTLRTNSWRSGRELPLILRPHNADGAFVNGSLHWQTDSEQDFLIAFDLATETYHEVPLPLPASAYANDLLGVLDGCLCMMVNTDIYRASLWVMKEYGVRESWTILVKISDPAGDQLSALAVFDVPLLTLKKGELLLQVCGLYQIYNVKDNTLKSSVMPNAVHDFVRQSCIYAESLVSPNANDSLEGGTNSKEINYTV